MAHDWHDRPATALPRSHCHRLRVLNPTVLLSCLLLLIVFHFPSTTTAIQSVPGSPCESVCRDAGSIEDDVVCLDANYQSLGAGRAFQTCVACQLNSTAVDTANNQTDVEWGLLALRYTLSGCMFAIPEDHISISSPCQVSCATLNASVGYQITNDSSSAQPGNQFCNAAPFDDATINKCATCYSFIPQQLYLANFLQALHISCRDPPEAGKPFFPDADAIFNETLIAGPAPPSSGNGGGGGLHGWKLALAIALPIVGGILLIGGTCWCCFTFTRKRRQRMASTGRMSRVHDAYADSTYQSPMSAKAEMWKAEQLPWGVVEPAREMHDISPSLTHHINTGGAVDKASVIKQHSPGYAQGRWSHQTGATASEQNTPLRSSFQRDEVGPGPEQVRDPNLHEQYFGVGDDPDLDGLPGPSHPGASAVPNLSNYPAPAPEQYHAQTHPQFRFQDDERGQFI